MGWNGVGRTAALIIQIALRIYRNKETVRVEVKCFFVINIVYFVLNLYTHPLSYIFMIPRIRIRLQRGCAFFRSGYHHLVSITVIVFFLFHLSLPLLEERTLWLHSHRAQLYIAPYIIVAVNRYDSPPEETFNPFFQMSIHTFRSIHICIIDE